MRDELRTCACGTAIAYPHARTCASCSRASSRRHRSRHRAAHQRRYRETASLRTPLEQAVRSARAYLGVYLRRGKVQKAPCAVCATSDVVPVQPWPDRPLTYLWACRGHRSRVEAELLAGVREPDGDPRIVPHRPRSQRKLGRACAEVQAPPVAVTRANVDELLAKMPEEEAAALRARARRVGPIVVETTAPMYTMQLVRFVEQALAARDREPTTQRDVV